MTALATETATEVKVAIPDVETAVAPAAEPWVAEVRVWAASGQEIAYGAAMFEGWNEGAAAVDAATEKAVEKLYEAAASAKLGLGAAEPCT